MGSFAWPPSPGRRHDDGEAVVGGEGEGLGVKRKRLPASDMVPDYRLRAVTDDGGGQVDRHVIPWRRRHVIPSSGLQFMFYSMVPPPCPAGPNRRRRSPARA